MDAPNEECSAFGVGFIIYGERDAGRVEEHAHCAVETRFAHINGLPLVPSGSMQVLPYGQRFVIPRHSVSVLAAYGRVYPAIVGGVVAVGALAGETTVASAGMGLGAVALFGLWAASFRLGKLSAEEHRQRDVYRVVTGFGADPALLAFGRPHLEGHLRRDLGARAERLAPDGYRDALADWHDVAARAAEADPSYLALALTLARIEKKDVLHEAIWRRLSPIVDRLPSSISPLTSFDGAEERGSGEAQGPQRDDATTASAAAPAPSYASTAAPAPPPMLETRRGEILERGFDVTVPAGAYVPPGLCASCCAPAERTLDATTLFGSKRVLVPYCGACHAHAIRQTTGNAVGQVLAFGAGLAAAGAAMLVGPSLVVCLAVGVLASTLAAIGVAAAFPARRAVVPATVARDAARLVSARGGELTIFCKSHEWSSQLAAAHGASRVARRRVDPRFLGAGALGIVLGPFAAGAAWHFGNPELKVDNGTDAPVAVWVDGRVVATIAPTPRADAPALDSVRVHFGARTIGWSPVGASKPTETAQLSVSPSGESYLLDPDARHCYWVRPMVYGDARVDDRVAGVWPVGLVHDTREIDDWFREGPASMSLKKGESVVRYELWRHRSCDELAECSVEARAAYWRCMGAVQPDAADTCAPVARKACGWE